MYLLEITYKVHYQVSLFASIYEVICNLLIGLVGHYRSRLKRLFLI